MEPDRANLSAGQRLDSWESARLFGLLNMALADGYVELVRHEVPLPLLAAGHGHPRRGDDGNPATSADPTWTPLVTTPPIPDYDSAHSVEGGAAAEVFRRVLRDRPHRVQHLQPHPAGREHVRRRRTRVALVRELLPGGRGERLSRILIGFHFRKAVREGIEHGRQIGNRACAINRFLLPV